MRCQRCQLENIPGQKNCIRCGSVLEIRPETINIYPPRTAAWKKPLRGLLRFFRRSRIISDSRFRFNLPLPLKTFVTDNLLGLALSVIPGLAHLLQRRFKEIRLFVFVWAALLFAGIFLFGGQIGLTCIGLAVSVHTFIALHSGILKNWDSFRKKIALAVIIAISISMLYNAVPRRLLPKLHVVYSTMNITDYKIKERDSLLAWDYSISNIPLPQGTLVVVSANTFQGQIFRHTAEIMGEIIAVGGQTVEIKNGFIINGKPLKQSQFPIPDWLKGIEFSTTVPDDCYFINVVYNVGGHGVKLDSSYISQICIVKKNSVKAKVFMRWQPLWTRGLLKVN